MSQISSVPDYERMRSRYAGLLDKANRAEDDGRRVEAEILWRQFIALAPDDPLVNFNLGVCVERRAKTQQDEIEAVEFYRRTAENRWATMEQRADAMNNIGLIVDRAGFTDKAATAYGFALKMWPQHKAARINMGDAKRVMGDWKGAASEYDAVLDLDPESAEARLCAGMIALLFGEYERGWRDYRWRYKTKNFKSKPYSGDKPLWQGESLDGKTLLLVAEQGWGDQMMMARYPAELKRRWPSCRVSWHCDPSLHRLFGGVAGLDAAVFEPKDGFDCVCHVMDLPGWCGMTKESDIPPAHCIHPAADWPEWRFERTERKRIALIWAGSPTHGKDALRSIPATAFQPLIDAHPECDFFSLQAGSRQSEAADLAGITDLAPQITNWTDTARMLLSMDLLVSVDTACVHLAGCLDVPCRVLIPFSPDWRWRLATKKSEWYPKAVLYRQETKDDWSDPINRIILDLAAT